jgi:hypothetical protein
MFFSNKKEKLRRLKNNLADSINKTYLERRNSCLSTHTEAYLKLKQAAEDHQVPAHYYQAFLGSLIEILDLKDPAGRPLAEQILHTQPISHSKEYFSWNSFNFLENPENLRERIANSKKQVDFYCRAKYLARDLQKAQVMEADLNLARELRTMKESVPSVGARGDVTVAIDNQENIFGDLCMGLVGGLAACGALALGILWALPALCTGTYFGSVRFLLDATAYLLTSLAKLVASAVFPLALVYSKYTTNSFNIFKSKNARILDSIVALHEEQPVHERALVPV